MEKRTLSLICLIILFFSLPALTSHVNAYGILYRRSQSVFKVPPATDWNITFGGYSGEEAFSVKQTDDGGYIIIGTTSSFGGAHEAMLVRTDSFGNLLWNRTYAHLVEDDGRALDLTTDGGFILAGGCSSKDGKADAWLVKTDALGNISWSKTYGGSEHDYAFSVQQVTDGGYILAGVTVSYGNGGNDFFLVKTDDEGVVEWFKAFGGTENDIAWSVLQTSDEGYVLAGETNSFGAGHRDAWVVKTDSNGDCLWNKTYGRSEVDDRIYCIQETSDLGYIMAGCADRRPALRDSGNFWLIKTDAEGNIMWNKEYGDLEPNGIYEEASSVYETQDGGYIVLGDSHLENVDTWIVKTDFMGNMEWNQTYVGGSEHGSIIQTVDGGYAFVTSTISYGAGSSDFWLVKLMRANPPVSNFTYSPNDPFVDEEVSLNASSSSDLDSDITSYYWDFDDGNTSHTTNPIINHTFEASGDYEVMLTVMDSEDLNSSYSQIISVRIKTNVSISVSPSSTIKGFDVQITGQLRDLYGNHLENKTVNLYFSNKQDDWNLIASNTTIGGGNYSFEWTPMVLGNLLVKVDWNGDSTYSSTFNVTNLSVKVASTSISLSLSSTTSLIGLKIKMQGSLTSEVGALSGASVFLSYSVTKGETWNDITLVQTDVYGNFSAVWIPSATGNYLVKAFWEGNLSFSEVQTIISLAVTSPGGKAVFSVVSNSTVSALYYNSTRRDLTFIVEGPSKTTGHVSVYIAESLLEKSEDIMVYLNDTRIDFSVELLDDSWLLEFTCPHSIHRATVHLGDLSSPLGSTLGLIVLVATIALLLIITTYIVRARKRKFGKTLARTYGIGGQESHAIRGR